jgi:hypothetical protein
MASKAAGNEELPVFQTTQIVAYQADVQAWECPCFVEDISLSNIQFGANMMGKAVSSIGMELGRRADRVFLARMNTQYDPSTTLDLNGYSNVQGMSQGRNMLGQKAVSGWLINLIDYEQFNNLLTDDRSLAWTIQSPPSTSASTTRVSSLSNWATKPHYRRMEREKPEHSFFSRRAACFFSGALTPIAYSVYRHSFRSTVVAGTSTNVRASGSSLKRRLGALPWKHNPTTGRWFNGQCFTISNLEKEIWMNLIDNSKTSD